jgi:eukaryotic-like serine/threonine-protein kinase
VDGKWRLDALCGIGGMSSVYAATRCNGTRAAIKLLHPEIALDHEAKARFLREGYVANNVWHPGWSSFWTTTRPPTAPCTS